MTHLVGDEVLTDRERHLDSIGFMSDRDSIHLELVSPVQCVGLAHCIFEHLLVAFLAQHSANVHQARFTATASNRAALQDGQKQHAANFHWPQERHRKG